MSIKKGNILIVEDNVFFRDSVSNMLKRSGYRVWTANSGEQGLEKLQVQQSSVDLILLDYSLPSFDGVTFLETIRATGRYAETPVIVMTALAKKDLVLKFKELKIENYLVKASFSLIELRNLVKKAIESRNPKSPKSANSNDGEIAE
jgi:CheY-like chemotaxis protein